VAGEALEQLIASLRRLKADAGEELAKEAAPAVQEVLRTNAAAGLDPEGRAWTPRKDGARALANAAGAIFVEARGAVLELVLRGKYIYHQDGAGVPERVILPDAGAGVPKILVAPIQKAAERVVVRLMGGGR
jgi:hypothetical protein